MDISHERYVSTFNSLPPVIRSYIVDGSVAPIIEDIGKKYSFHVDVIGKLEQESTYMLMGLISPAEILGEMVLSNISSDVAKSVLQDLNSRIFTPLQKRIREDSSMETVIESGSDALSEASTASGPQETEDVGEFEVNPALESALILAQENPESPVPSAISPPAILGVERPGREALANVPNVSLNVPTVASEPNIMAVNVIENESTMPAPIYGEPAPLAPPVAEYHPQARTMESDIERLTQEPVQQAAPFPQQPMPAPTPYIQAPTPSFPPSQPPPVMVYQPPVSSAAPPVPPPMPPVYAPEPIAPQAQVAPPPESLASSYPPPAMASVRLTPVGGGYPNAPITKEYGSDPYREPIE